MLNSKWSDRRHWKLDRLVTASVPVLTDDPLKKSINQRLKIAIVRTECLKEVGETCRCRGQKNLFVIIKEDQSRVQLDLCPVDENAPKQVCIHWKENVKIV
jgi:hypothetical protein